MSELVVAVVVVDDNKQLTDELNSCTDSSDPHSSISTNTPPNELSDDHVLSFSHDIATETLSGDIEDAIKELSNTNSSSGSNTIPTPSWPLPDELAFSPIEYINTLLPEINSLADIDMAIARVQMRKYLVEEDATRDIRKQRTTWGYIKYDIINTKSTIKGLQKKFCDIKAKADQAELMMKEICKEMTAMDNAKLHLSITITTLERLQMVSKGMEQLKTATIGRNYHSVCNLVGAIDQLLQTFDDYKYVPHIRSLNDMFAMLKTELSMQIREEFERFGLIQIQNAYLPARN